MLKQNTNDRNLAEIVRNLIQHTPQYIFDKQFKNQIHDPSKLNSKLTNILKLET